jgi:hypothetical protein
MCKPSQTQVQVQIRDEAYWRKRLEELGVRFDEIVVEVLKIDLERRSNPYEPIVNSISQYVSDLASRLFGLAEEINSDMCEKRVLLALAKLEDIADDMKAYVKNIRKVLPGARP